MLEKRLEVSAEGKKVYDIVIENSFSNLVKELSALDIQERKLCIVTERRVASYYLEEVKSILEGRCAKVEVYIFQEGEVSKNLSTVDNLYHFLITHEFDRKDMLLALGGGVTGDLTGFAAATYLRGIDFVQIPTSLLAQVDSSIGGKTGIDFMQYKNMVGAFYQPKLVYMNLSVLHSLPGKQIVSGMGEIIKHGLIKDASYFEWLIAHEKEIWALDPEILEEMIYISCNIKRDVVERDPKEQGERALLNFGHTIGHAIEKLSDFSLYHGECVGLGIVAASYLSMQLGHISKEDFDKIQNALSLFELPTQMDGFNAEKVLSATKSDKKMVGNQVKFILLKEIGNAYIYRELTDEQILDGIRYVCHS